MDRDHSVILEIASKYCISDSFVDYDGYSISSNLACNCTEIFILDIDLEINRILLNNIFYEPGLK